VLEPLEVICFIRDGVLAELRGAGAQTEGPHSLIGSWEGLAEMLHLHLISAVCEDWCPVMETVRVPCQTELYNLEPAPKFQPAVCSRKRENFV
jgi:hypothetical protein